MKQSGMTSVRPLVTIVLASRNGAAFIEAQLRSIAHQTYDAWHVLLSDDGSTDDTCARAMRALPKDKLTLRMGPQRGLAANFLSALDAVPHGSYLAFCDQDDVWMPHKLHRAITALRRTKRPAFYTAARLVTGADLTPIAVQRRRKTGFMRLMYRSVAPGNTMVMSPHAVGQLRAAFPKVQPAFHDWWAALVLLGSGAHWINDPKPCLMYRQHGANVLGAYGGRLTSVLDGTRAGWIARNIAALEPAEDLFTPPNVRRFRMMKHAFRHTRLRAHPPLVTTAVQLQEDMLTHAKWLRKVEEGDRALR